MSLLVLPSVQLTFSLDRQYRQANALYENGVAVMYSAHHRRFTNKLLRPFLRAKRVTAFTENVWKRLTGSETAQLWGPITFDPRGVE